MHPKSIYATTAIAAGALLAGGIYLGTHIGTKPEPSRPESATPQPSQAEIDNIRSIPKPKAPTATGEHQTHTTASEINALVQLNQVSAPPQTDIRIIEHLLDQVHTVFHELPTGDHDEVVAFLRGANPRSIQYIPDEDPNLNEEGEIIDRWGTPYFFHTLSRDHIEVRSAGPDRLHWSEDDVVSESQSGGQGSVAAANAP